MKVKFLKYTFSLIFNRKKENKLSSKNMSSVRLIVAKYSRGSVSLQKGNYSTESEIDKRREDICNYRFK